jgi:DNA-binding NarL/FixJ family response regulator
MRGDRPLVEVVEERLAPRHRAVLELRSAGFKEVEIATRLGLSERQVGPVLDEAPKKLGPACEILAARGR